MRIVGGREERLAGVLRPTRDYTGSQPRRDWLSPRAALSRRKGSPSMTARILTFPFLAVSALALVGCTSQPTSPSVLPAIGAPSSPATAAPVSTEAAGGRRASAGVIHVTGQGLYFDTFVVKDPLPMKGPFQPLFPSETGGISETPFGPGDPGYLGGRWWVDTDTNGVQNEGDHFFLCPLLGPGRPTP
jgi:hypothetical protein